MRGGDRAPPLVAEGPRGARPLYPNGGGSAAAVGAKEGALCAPALTPGARQSLKYPLADILNKKLIFGRAPGAKRGGEAPPFYPLF